MTIDSTVVKCPECNSRNLASDQKHGERYCQDCGMLVEDKMLDYGAEWVAKSTVGGVDEQSRVGLPVNYMMHDKGLSTEIGWTNRDYSGAQIRGNASQMYRMRQWQRRVRTKSGREKNLQNAIKMISTLGTKLGIPRTDQEESAMLYRRGLEMDLLRGRPIKLVVGAIMFIVNRKNDRARTIDEYAIALEIPKKELGRAYREMRRRLKVKINPTSPIIFVERYCNSLGLSPETQTATRELLDICRERELLDGKSPSGVTAAAIYITSHMKGQARTQREISEVCNVTEVTIRNRYKQMLTDLSLDFDIAASKYPNQPPVRRVEEKQ